MFGNKEKYCPKISVVIVASGNSTRMGENKLLMEIFDEPVIGKTLEVFDMCEKVSEIILVCRHEDMLQFSEICNIYVQNTAIKLVAGGKERTNSTLNGLRACDENADLIGIHDGARPLVTVDIIESVIDSALEHKASIPVVLAKDTMKYVEDGKCTQTLNRSMLYSVQTPQFFEAELIKKCSEKADKLSLTYTDDSSCVEHFGTTVHTVLGSYENIKITTIEDVSLAHAIIESREI